MAHATHAGGRTKAIIAPSTRFVRWYSASLLLLGPFGFVIGPLLSRMTRRRAPNVPDRLGG